MIADMLTLSGVGRKRRIEMERVITDTPNSNTETMLNYAFVKDKNVALRYADGEDDIDLCEYVSRLAKKKGCNISPESIMEGSCIECGCVDCDCEVGILYVVAVQAAELRQRLKSYVDTGLTPEEIAKATKWNKLELEYNEELQRQILVGPLPDDAQKILATDGKNAWEDTFMVDGDECYLDDSGCELVGEVTHWMPMPKPPKETE